MPRPYKGYSSRAEYRNAVARQRGYQSYWHERQTALYARYIPQAPIRRRFVDLSKDHPSRQWRNLFMEGQGFMVGMAYVAWGKGSASAWRDAGGDYAARLGWTPQMASRDPLGAEADDEADAIASLWWYHDKLS